MQLSDFHYSLPPELIARYPLEKRSASRLLQVNEQGKLKHSYFTDFGELVSKKDLIVFNNSKVIPARLKGHKETGGRVEILVERLVSDQRILAHLRASKPPAIGSYLQIADIFRLKIEDRQQNLFILYCDAGISTLELIERFGEIPLPPYLHRQAEAQDKERYQTIYAEPKGSVAAPTAGLHFDQATLDSLQKKGVEFAFLTLHVGAGTFLPVRTKNILEHTMHPEYVHVSQTLCEKVKHTRAEGGRIIAIGTTTARSLETASRNGEIQPYEGYTNLFIYPGYTFRCVDLILTNFHLPESTLLMLVCALGGQKNIMSAYEEAVKYQYRFYSYGDAMLVGKVLPFC